MIPGLNTVWLSVIGGLVLTMLGMVWYIDTLQEENKELSRSIDIQNAEIDKLGTEYATRVKEFYDTKPKVVTKYVKTYISKEVDVNRSECADVNTVFDNIRHIGL